ncbi:hypothetical protein [Chryseobacterium kwangjuense]|uniref:Uncharacterized protein n=1 Tax=Chryseobacterium kwangjuense TaxID=267125 RepID=A0A135WJH7_9FLAO|nr:hypothetical protein [Chryseobacterium kwangjuense]KXH85056.1 hypothetical protein AU378_04690 [Chryseobacterium kwangjuense]
MGLGLEIDFVFDKEEPLQQYLALRDQFHFDARDGLNLLMSGDGTDDEYRLLWQMERALATDMKILDFWEFYEEYIDLELLKSNLIQIQEALKIQPEFYKKIAYGHDVEEGYLKEKFAEDVSFLIERLNMNIMNRAEKVMFVTW